MGVPTTRNGPIDSTSRASGMKRTRREAYDEEEAMVDVDEEERVGVR